MFPKTSYFKTFMCLLSLLALSLKYAKDTTMQPNTPKQTDFSFLCQAFTQILLSPLHVISIFDQLCFIVKTE